MNEGFVSYEQAVKLKELGFDFETWTFYYTKLPDEGVHTNEMFTDWNGCGLVDTTSAPTISQVQKWLREVKGIIIYSEPRFYKGKKPLLGYIYHLFDKDNGYYSHIESETVYDTYEEALLACIDQILEDEKNVRETNSSNHNFMYKHDNLHSH